MRVTAAVREHPLIEVVEGEVEAVPDGIVVIASGPLTSDALAADVARLTGSERLSFYDAAAPVIAFDSINMDVAWRAGRYEQSADYINCPFTKDEYLAFFGALEQARSHTPHDWEKLEFFEGCMPIEEIARRGIDTPRFGPMSPRAWTIRRPGAGRTRSRSCVRRTARAACGRWWASRRA